MDSCNNTLTSVVDDVRKLRVLRSAIYQNNDTVIRSLIDNVLIAMAGFEVFTFMDCAMKNNNNFLFKRSYCYYDILIVTI